MALRQMIPAALAGLVLAGASAIVPAPGTGQAAGQEGSYRKSVVSVDVPDATLRGRDGTPVPLRAALDAGKPVMVNFIFTTCGTICPVMSAIFSTVREDLGADREKIRMVSITIDPENDTPAVLRRYAERFDADGEWLFLTGDADDIAAVQRAFGVSRRTKMSHPPYTFLRRSPDAPWIRIEEIVGADDLGREARAMIRGQ